MRTDLRGIFVVAVAAVLLAGCTTPADFEPLEKIDRTARNVEHTLGSVTRNFPPGQEMMNLPQYVRRICQGYAGNFKADCIGEALLISETRRNNIAAVIDSACTLEDAPFEARVICFDTAVTLADNDVLKKIMQKCNPHKFDFADLNMQRVLAMEKKAGEKFKKKDEELLLSKKGERLFLWKAEYCYDDNISIMKWGSDPFKPKEEPKKPQESPPVKKQKP